VPLLIRDYETRGVLDLRAVGAFKYAADPRTEVLCAGYAVDDGPVKLWRPGEPVPREFKTAARDPDWIVAAFSDAFETTVETHILAPRFRWPRVSLERHRCIQAQALAHALPASLGGCAKALGLGHQKDAAGNRVMRQLSRPRRPRQGEDPNSVHWFEDADRLERLYAYCKADVECERELAGQLRPLCSREQVIWALDAKINSRGIAIDTKVTEAAQKIIDAALVDLDRENAELTGGAVTQTSQVARIVAWAATQGCNLPSLNKNDLATTLAGKLPAPVRQVLGLRLEAAQAATKKIAALLDWAGADGRVRGSLRFCGAATGRWTGSGPQLQNLKKLPEDIDVPTALKAIGTGNCRKVKAAGFGNPLELIGSTIRPVLIAKRGCRFIGADLKGIEARICAWLSGEMWKLDAFAKEDHGGLSVYAVTAGRIYGRDPTTITKDMPEREVGKRCELAFSYAGGLGAWRNFEKYGTDVEFSDAEIERFKLKWRALHPKIVAFWAALNIAAIKATWRPGEVARAGRIAFRRDGDFLYMKLPSSRRIAYPFPRLVTGRMQEPVLAFMDNSEGRWRPCRNGQGTYGGALCENAVSGTARDVLAEALVRLERAGYAITLHCHDEALAEMRDGRGSVDEFRRIFTQLPAWAEGLPVSADVFEGQRYVKV
jgi:DNA polymerase bacteriophage-type